MASGVAAAARLAGGASGANVPPVPRDGPARRAAERQRTPRRPGQPGRRPAVDPRTRAGATRPPGGRSTATCSATPSRPASPSCARRSPATTPAGTASRSTADDVVVTTGSSGGFLLAFLAAFEAGDRVAIARPGYPCYRNVLTALGLRGGRAADRAGDPLPADGRACSRSSTRPGAGASVVASPANPTGHDARCPTSSPRSPRWCEAHGVQLISDEIYHGISYDAARRPAGARRASAWETSREAVVFDSFSKYFSMTGWRIGWMLVPERLRRPVDVLTGNFTICPPAHRPAGRARRVHRRVVRRVRRPRRAVRRQPARAARRARARWASTGWPRPTARSTSTPTSATSPTTRWPSPAGCWPRPGWRSPPGSTSTPWRASRFVRLSFAGPERDVRDRSGATRRLAPRAAGRPDARVTCASSTGR